MDNPDLAEEFPSFTAPPWTSAASDPNILAQPQEQVIQANWEEWMQWDQKTSSDPVELQKTPELLSGCGDSSSQTDTLSSKEHSQSPDALLRPIPEVLGGNTFSFDPTFTTNVSFDMSAAAFPSPPEIKDIAPSDTFLDTSDSWEQNTRANQLPQLGLELASVRNFNPPLPTPSTDRSSQSPAKNTAMGSDSSPEPMNNNANKKKRKVSDDEDEDSGITKQGPVKKTAHNMIEKRYRTNLNDKIAALRDSVPSLRVMSRPNGTLEDDDPEDLEGLTPAHKLNKATVLSKATEYIRHLERRNKKLNEELLDYKNRLEAMGKMAMSGPMIHPGMMNMPDSTIRYQEDAFSTASSHSHATKPIGPPQGLIPVPESMANLHRRHPNQPHYAHSHSQYASYAQPPHRQGIPNQQPMVHGRGGNGMMNKIMIGSFAGLMVLEGFSQHGKNNEDPESKGLFAVPVHLLREILGPSLSRILGPSEHMDLLPLVKFLLVAMAFATLAGPLFSFRAKSKKAALPVVRVITGLSLASPIELRKQAWLTAVQSIWVPRHSFLLEIAALALKLLKLSTRKMIGWQGYALITGTTKEQEDGRVKAWSIAWDAQLTGGDSEINVLRLILTLMASGTLPDTPARLMLKALHIRILLWEVANSGYGKWYKFEAISAKLSRKYWKHARAEHNIAVNQKGTAEGDRLPPHLASLIEIHCDDVLVHPIIQRAYNLAWDKPSAENTSADSSLDTVVEDFAISSPLDALAAWWSSLMLNRALVSYLAEDEGWAEDLDLAVSVAPPNSGAHIRALVAKSILTDKDREQTIAAAFNAVPSKLQDRIDISRGSGLMNVVGNSPVPPDVIKTLTLARCVSLVEMSKSSGSEEARLRATYPIATINTTEYGFSLLSFVAAYRILIIFTNDTLLLDCSKRGLEHLASSLRLWIGHESGRNCGLSSETRGSVVEKCLNISKVLTGMKDAAESDDGYVSGDEMTTPPVVVEKVT